MSTGRASLGTLVGLALGGFRRKLGRNALTMAGVVIGVLSLTLIIALGQGIPAAVRAVIGSGESARLIIIQPGLGAEEETRRGDEIEIDEAIPADARARLTLASRIRFNRGRFRVRPVRITDEAIAKMAAVEGVESATPLVISPFRTITTLRPETTVRLRDAEAVDEDSDPLTQVRTPSMIHGLDAERARWADRVIAGRYFSDAAADEEVLLHEYVAYEWGITDPAGLASLIGARVTLDPMDGAQREGGQGGGGLSLLGVSGPVRWLAELAIRARVIAEVEPRLPEEARPALPAAVDAVLSLVRDFESGADDTNLEQVLTDAVAGQLPEEQRAAAPAIVHAILELGREYASAGQGTAGTEDGEPREGESAEEGEADASAMSGDVATLPRSFRIVGIVRGLSPDDSVRPFVDPIAMQADFFTTLPVARALFRATPGAVNGYPTAMVFSRTASETAVAEAGLREIGFSAISVDSILDEVGTSLEILTILVGLITGIALVVAALGIVNTMVTSVLERTREIGLWKAIGATDGQVRAVFLFEAGLIGVVGGLLGLGLALALMPLIDWIGGDLIAARIGFAYAESFFDVPLWLVFAGPILATVVATISAILPARRASRVDPVTALRHD